MKIARVEAMILRAGEDTSPAAAKPRMGIAFNEDALQACVVDV
ncbi:MAG: hypothetical protein U9R48_07485 [Chloroflexota bacterium]|nr:hypothetical protein [Chloroflexota bacterium]